MCTRDSKLEEHVKIFMRPLNNIKLQITVYSTTLKVRGEKIHWYWREKSAFTSVSKRLESRQYKAYARLQSLPFNLLVCVPKYNSHTASFRLPRFCGAKHKIHTRGCQQPPRATKNPTQQGRNGAKNIWRHLALSHYAKQNTIQKSSFQERAPYFSDTVKNLVPKEAVHRETKAAVSPDSVTLITPEMTLLQPTEGTPLGRARLAPLVGRGAGAARRRLPASAAERRRSPRRYRKRTLKAQRSRLLCGKEGGCHPSGTSSGQEGRGPGGQRRARCSPLRARGAGGRGREPAGGEGHRGSFGRRRRAWPGPCGGRAQPGRGGLARAPQAAPRRRPPVRHCREPPPPPGALPKMSAFGASRVSGRGGEGKGGEWGDGERWRAKGRRPRGEPGCRPPYSAGGRAAALGAGARAGAAGPSRARGPSPAAGRAPGLPPPPPGRLSRRVPGGVF